MLDVLYVVREPRDSKDAHETLRYSLRSLANLVHGDVWIAGYKPEWCTNVRHVETVQSKDPRRKSKNSTGNFMAFCQHDGAPEKFVYMNDDFYILDPVSEVPVWNRGTVDDVVSGLRSRYGRHHGAYREGLRLTGEVLRSEGVDVPWCFELHCPMVVDRGRFLYGWGLVEDTGMFDGVPLHKRTLVGNLMGLSGVTVDDLKIGFGAQPTVLPRPFVSSAPRSWQGWLGGFVRDRFPEPSRFET